jgi:peptide/nickel transport system ATP-binding protein
MTTPIVDLKNIYMYFDSGDGKPVQAAHKLNLSIYAKDMIAVIGESGCGKSTIGKIVLGVQKPSEGSVTYGDWDIWKQGMPPRLRHKVQVIHQDAFSSLNPVRTIYQTLEAPIKTHLGARTKEEVKREVIKLLDCVDLKPADFFMEKYPFQLSGGQRQRVSIARATILKPELIVADEPVSAVDASLRLTILDLMRNLSEEHQIAFLYITHDLATARYFAPQGKLVVMYLGRMVESGIIEDCIQAPFHPYLQALLKAIPSPDSELDFGVDNLPLKSLDMPNPKEPPRGCVFHPRCPYGDRKCETEEPLLEITESKSGSSRSVACHHFKDLKPSD